MKKMHAALITGLFLAANSYAATERENYVFFDVQGLSSFSFTESSHSVTSGQPYSGTTAGVKKEDGHDQAYVLVKAGRKGSDSVASWFKTQAKDGQTLACDSSGTYPNQLNFAVQGTLKFTTQTKRNLVCDNVIIGQGHFGTNNNWWMGSPTMTGAHISITGATSQFCKAEGEILPVAVVFTPKTPCVNHFSISTLN